MSLKASKATLTPILKEETKIPLCLKDIYHLKGHITSGGSRPMMNHVSPDSADIVNFLSTKWEVISKDNLDEMAVGDSGYSTLGGRTSLEGRANDHIDLGGSSTGTTVNVVCGKAKIGIGSDTGGSIRDVVYPHKGLVGFKPT